MNVCVFCGSSAGTEPAYAQAAREVGAALGRGGHTLVYGGAGVGLMGVLADAALEAGASVVGVLPRALFEKERAHPGLTELVVVETMHQRKAEMAELADGFLTLPGGLGTLDETFEILTWAQLGIHGKPVGFLDVEGYFDSLLAFVDHAVDQGFVPPAHRDLFEVGRDPEALLDGLAGWEGPSTGAWLEPDER